MAYVGVAAVPFECRDETIQAAEVAKGARVVSYLHYQRELARKPQAVRKAAPELIGELGEPYGLLWKAVCERYSEPTAARVLAALIGLRIEHGDEQVRSQIEELLSSAAAPSEPLPAPQEVNLATRLSGLEIRSATAADYDLVLVTGGTR